MMHAHVKCSGKMGSVRSGAIAFEDKIKNFDLSADANYEECFEILRLDIWSVFSSVC